MAMDLIVRGANLPDGRAGVDIGVHDGRIVAVEPALEAEAGQEIDASGRLVSPPFVDAHFHMDATLARSLTRALPASGQSGLLFDGINMWDALKQRLSAEEVVERALTYCDMAIAQGIQAIRSHVDVCDERLTGVEALLEVKRRVAGYIDLQLIAFPQMGYYRYAGAQQHLKRALDMGVDVVGGIPHFERTMADGTASVSELLEIAAERGLLVDMHCDETDDPLSRHVETLSRETLRLGLQGRVAASHLTSMHVMDNYYVSKLIPLIAESEIDVIPNPLTNIAAWGDNNGSYPKWRGMTRVPELREAGITLAFGQDCVMDPWYVYGSADMLEVAHMGSHVAAMFSDDQVRACFDAVTVNPARILHLEGYGLEPGCHADMIVLQAADPLEAIRLKATRLAVIRRGEVIARTPAAVTELSVPGRPNSVALTYRPADPGNA